MEQKHTSPIVVTFEQQTLTKQSTQAKPEVTIKKTFSQPKIRSYKQQILKIPKVKQILNKDKFVYSQDIEKRMQLIGTLKNDNYEKKQMNDLFALRKTCEKKSKRHKTNFKIPLTRNNIQSLNNLIVKNIGHNQKFKNQEVIFLKQYSENAPFDLQQLKFMDKLDQVKVKFSQKYPQLNQKVLSKNKLLLQNVILNRNIKRQIKLDNKKQQKLHQKNVFKSIQYTNFEPQKTKGLSKKSSAKKKQKSKDN